jgi:hypothetical protein
MLALFLDFLCHALLYPDRRVELGDLALHLRTFHVLPKYFADQREPKNHHRSKYDQRVY